MKTKLILGSLLALSVHANAQWSNTCPPFTGCNVGIGTASPADNLEIVTGVVNSGATIRQTNFGACALNLQNNTAGGQKWALFSTGNGNSQGSGNFSIFQWGASLPDRLLINGTTGNVLIGATWNQQVSQFSRFTAQKMNFDGNLAWEQTAGLFEGFITNSSSSTVNHVIGAKGYINAANGIYANGVGLEGQSYVRSTAINNNSNFGVRAIAAGGDDNYGVHGNASSGSNKAGATTAGVSGQAHADQGNAFGIEGFADNTPGAPGTVAAGMFWGDINCNGTWYISDRQFKDNIKPVVSVLDKLKLLKPSTYSYKTKEFSYMNFTDKEVTGLVAQDVEEVFPELIKNMTSMSYPDPNASKEEKGKRINMSDFKTVNYVGLIPVLIAGIQEQQKMIEDQQKVNADLKSQLTTQQMAIDQLMGKALSTGLEDLSADQQMSQNEPNPFTGETVIKYNLASTVSAATLNIYDLNGKQLRKISLNIKNQDSITFKSEDLAAGIYIYSIVADNKIVDTKRMIVSQ